MYGRGLKDSADEVKKDMSGVAVYRRFKERLTMLSMLAIGGEVSLVSIPNVDNNTGSLKMMSDIEGFES